MMLIALPRFRFLPAALLCGLAALFLYSGQAAAQGLEEVRRWLYDSYETDLYGFVEVRGGVRTDRDLDERDLSIAETRLQIDLSRYLKTGTVKLKADFVADGVDEELRPELREANYAFSPASFMDVKVGRQVLTWGTGDLLFVNDLFPKDWESFFIGRDDEYLKAPSDALKTSFFSDYVNIDLVYMPVFNNSRYIDGERLSYWNGALGRLAGRDYVFDDHERNRVFRDSEFALRLYKTVGGTEYALYGYSGFWSTPEGLDPAAMKLFYPRLSVYGMSMRSTVLSGIANIEAGYYDSREDRGGTNPLVRNSEIRLLAGYERELARDLTGGIQYYLEWKQDYEEYKNSLPPGTPAADEYRHLLTVRLTRLLLNQNLKLSLFAYYSPSDRDAYLRPKAHYKITDQWAAEVGGNIFAGDNDYTFWGQFADNTNIYAGLRWSF